MQLTESDLICQAIWSKPFRRPLELCDGDLTTAICIHFASPCYLQELHGKTSGTAFSIYGYSCSKSSTKSIKMQARLLQIFDTRSLKWLLFCIKVSWSRSSTANLFDLLLFRSKMSKISVSGGSCGCELRLKVATFEPLSRRSCLKSLHN